jgi:hypothetical protein
LLIGDFHGICKKWYNRWPTIYESFSSDSKLILLFLRWLLGIFDDCDDVIAKLNKIRKQVNEPFSPLIVMKPNGKTVKDVYAGYLVKLDGVDYSKIVFKNEILADTVIRANQYYHYDENNLKEKQFAVGFQIRHTSESSIKIIVTNEKDSLTTYTRANSLIKYIFGNLPAKSDRSSLNIDFDTLLTVNWVSQKDETIFGACTGCWSNKCCRRASEYMLGNTNIANCSDTVIAKKAPHLAVTGIIQTATFANNSTTYNSTTYNSANLTYEQSKGIEAELYLTSEIRLGRPILIGVHYTNGTHDPPNNTNKATRHFMVVVGMGISNGKKYFRFYDPGRSVSQQASATSPNNRLFFDSTNGTFIGDYYDRVYTLTEVIKTN